MESPSPVVEDLQGVVKLYGDGSIYRVDPTQFLKNIPVHHDHTVIWKDCQFHQQNNLNLRLYKPEPTISSTKLPIVYFFHGGGFCVGSCTWVHNHNACQRLASGLQALVVAPDYRLAPEHRLPAAVDDALASLEWLKAQALSETPVDAWLRNDEVDYGRVCIVGDSSGGNMAHHLAVQLGPGSPELAPVQVRGYVLMAPFFGGTVRTKSEAEGMPEPLLNLETLDRFWRLSLPMGKNADHPLANPFGPYSKNLESAMIDPMLIIAGENELLKDRVKNYASKLKEFGKKVDYLEFEGQHHGFFTNHPYSQLGDVVLEHIKLFISKISG